MKKILIGITAILAVLIAGGYLFRDQVFLALMASQIAPDHDFDLSQAPAAPDYGNLDSWAAHPDKHDPSDQLPEGTSRTPTGVAVFFVHPTSFLDSVSWNQPMDHHDANWVVDHRVLRHQASVFNGCCDVYAPRYRQATFYSFMDNGENGQRALELAYTDVVRAFEHFKEMLAPEQPFILAGHSQGTKHSARLLAEEIAPSAAYDRLVAAYLIGFSVTTDAIGGVPACTSARQTQCAVGWNAMDGVGAGTFSGVENLLCTNPLTWEHEGGYAPHEKNAGAIGFQSYQVAAPGEDYEAMNVEPGAADAECVDGQLAVRELRSAAFPSRMFGNSMHVYDYSLFHMSLRANALERISAFQQQQRLLYPDEPGE